MKVVVVGGGPAGACAAALLAKARVEVVLLEKARFPRHHVGESLQPGGFTLLEHHLGLRFDDLGFANKFGAVYVWGESREPWRVLFDERLEADLDGLDEAGLLSGGYERALQVDRAVFDKRLLDCARSLGVDVREGVEAKEVRRDGARVVGIDEHDADVVIDASGQRCLVGRALGLTRLVSDLRCSATYGYFEGCGGFPGVLGRHVQWVVSIPDGWAWFIPISAERTSVGVVCRDKHVLDEERFSEATSCFPLGERDGGLRFARDWSFTNKRFAGDGFLLAGDAACFVDPILSGGVDFAIRSGFRAAHAVLSGDSAAYEQQFRREYNAYLRLARYWYGNNRHVDGLFWEAHRSIPEHATVTPLRAFVYLTTGRYAAEQHLKVFQQWQEEEMFRRLGVDESALREARGKKG